MNPGGKISQKERVIYIAGLISVILLTAFLLLTERERLFYYTPEEHRAFDLMKKSIETVSDCHPLIGPEMSDITTSLGDPAPKRTSLNPAMASLIVRLLRNAGVQTGDTIAVGCSGSFPGLLIATLSAADAMELVPRIIISIGASSYGASDPNFTILDLHLLLYREGLTGFQPIAVSIGGDMDTGKDMEKDTREKLISKINERGITFINEQDLFTNRHIRDSLYSANNLIDIKAFINSGGGYANMGSSNLSLLLKPGVIRKAKMPPQKSRGVIHDMLEKEIPVIHLLYIKGLATRHNIPWDSQ